MIKMKMKSRRVEVPNAMMVEIGKFTDKVMAKLGTDDLDAVVVVAAAEVLQTVTEVAEHSRTDKVVRDTVEGTLVTIRGGPVKMATRTGSTTDIKTDMVKTDIKVAEVTTATDIMAMVTLVIATNKMKMVVATDTMITRATRAASRVAAEGVLVAEFAARRGLLVRSTPVNPKKLNSSCGSRRYCCISDFTTIKMY